MRRAKRRSRTQVERMRGFDMRQQAEEEMNWNAYRPRRLTPEASLAMAVIERAICDAAALVAVSERDKACAIAWLRHKGEEPYTVRWLLAHMEIDQDYGQDAIHKEIELRRGEYVNAHGALVRLNRRGRLPAFRHSLPLYRRPRSVRAPRRKFAAPLTRQMQARA